MKKLSSMILAFVMVLVLVLSNASSVNAAYTVPENMKWWSDARFGMFIHFGSYSYYGHGEWAMQQEKISKETYQTTISAKFNPTKFDAEEIVKYAKKAGMKYLVITAKHHEGMAMWDTQVESFKDYTGTKIYSLQKYTPFGSTGRDVLMELKKACDKAGIKFGLYYSMLDWNHPSQVIYQWFSKMSSMEAREAYIKDMKAQIKELVDTYDPAVMWFDGDWLKYDGAPTLEKWWTKSDGEDLYNFVKELNPDILVNERVCREFGLGDYECPEQKVPKINEIPLRPWETNDTMNGAWGYKAVSEKSYKSVKTEVQELATVVSREGNLLLNIGPNEEGSMTDGQKTILEGVGKWMKINSDSIYGATRNPFGQDPTWGTYTQKAKKVYAHVFKWPTKTDNYKLQATALKGGKIKNIYLLSKPDTSLKYSVKNGTITINVPKSAPSQYNSVVVIEYSSIK